MKNLKLLYRLLIIVGVAIVGMVTLTAIDLITLRDNLMADRQDKIQNLVETAYALVEDYAAKEASGAMTRVEAQQAALERLQALRFGGANYFWVNDLDGVLLMHPHRAGRADGQVDPGVQAERPGDEADGGGAGARA